MMASIYLLILLLWCLLIVWAVCVKCKRVTALLQQAIEGVEIDWTSEGTSAPYRGRFW